ncbi:MAG: phosphopantothenoylcysteine decarboxylase / phosphopantothenate---cysteine ligase, partial [Nocardioidaceae bacterium]|nr:phosphopantothenoylcysteine decarboxylase / phosphopantothenate---cysteine ligase [Nocardioidaceae bacterium]
PDPAGVDVVRVISTEELRQQMHASAIDADAVIMAAAPADFRPAEFVDAKIKKAADGAAPDIRLVENPDILVELVTARTSKRPIIVGFAAETGDAHATVIEHARAKLTRKGCDLLVVNDVSAGKAFGRDDNEAVLLGADGTVDEIPLGPKIDLAHAVLDAVVQRMD